jgi:acetyl-CoA carboxylase alpha subunit
MNFSAVIKLIETILSNVPPSAWADIVQLLTHVSRTDDPALTARRMAEALASEKATDEVIAELLKGTHK